MAAASDGGLVAKRRKWSAYNARQRTTEWGICLLRWGLLASVVAIVQLNPPPGLALVELSLLLLAVAMVNLAVTLLLSFRVYSPLLSAVVLVVDAVFVLVLPFTSGGLQSPFLFFAIFPILVATLRFGWQIGVFTAFVFVLEIAFHTALAWDAALGRRGRQKGHQGKQQERHQRPFRIPHTTDQCSTLIRDESSMPTGAYTEPYLSRRQRAQVHCLHTVQCPA